MTARLGSLCTGYGGLGLAVGSLLPVEHMWHAEVDPAASKVLDAHWPDAANHGDITKAAWADAEPVDVLEAGWPCQPISGAGPQAGSEDERYLWPDVARSVGALRPTLFVGENVEDLLSIEQGAMFGRALADLDGMGYAVSWTTRGACLGGFCHHRERVFLAATSLAVPLPVVGPVAVRRDTGWVSCQGTLFGEEPVTRWPFAGLCVAGRVWARPTVRCAGLRVPLLPTPTARDATRGAGWGDQSGRPLSEVVCHYGRFEGTKFEAAIRRHERVLGRPAPSPIAAERNRVDNVMQSAEFPEWMQCLPAGWITDHVGREDGLRLAGNGVNPRQAAAALPTLPTFRAATAALTTAASAA